MLRATTACTFSTSQLPKVVRTWCALYILTSKCASRHNGVQFFISHLASWLCARRFSEPTCRPSGATNHWKNKVFRDFPTFSPTWIFFLLRLFAHLDFLSSETFSFFFSSLLFSDSSHLCFSSVHIVGSLTSKLPSIRYIILYYIILYYIVLYYIISYHIILYYIIYIYILSYTFIYCSHSRNCEHGSDFLGINIFEPGVLTPNAVIRPGA